MNDVNYNYICIIFILYLYYIYIIFILKIVYYCIKQIKIAPALLLQKIEIRMKTVIEEKTQGKTIGWTRTILSDEQLARSE